MAKMVEDGEVIVTLLGRERVADAAARDRFTAEARVARRVAPFCAARILDAGIEAHVPYLVTEYVAGSTLIETVWREGPLTSPGLDAVAIGTATGLMPRSTRPGWSMGRSARTAWCSARTGRA